MSKSGIYGRNGGERVRTVPKISRSVRGRTEGSDRGKGQGASKTLKAPRRGPRFTSALALNGKGRGNLRKTPEEESEN